MLELGARLSTDGSPSYLVASRAETYLRSLEPEQRRELSRRPSSIGPEDAPITLVEFSDFECPACRRAHPMLSRLLEAHPETLRLEFRNFPLPHHAHARHAARAAIYAQSQGKFAEFAEAAFSSEHSLDEEGLKQIARLIELDEDALWAAAEGTPEIEEQLQADIDEGRSIPLQGTPTLFINGRVFRLPLNPEFLNWAVEDELAFMENPEGWIRPKKKEPEPETLEIEEDESS